MVIQVNEKHCRHKNGGLRMATFLDSVKSENVRHCIMY